jgi:hypothetical protein
MERILEKARWTAQWTLAVAFELTGMCKLGFEAHQLRGHFGYAAAMTTPMLHGVAAIEIALAVLVILPALLDLLPQLSLVAAAALGGIALFGVIQPSSAAASGFPGIDLALFAVAALVIAGRFAHHARPIAELEHA